MGFLKGNRFGNLAFLTLTEKENLVYFSNCTLHLEELLICRGEEAQGYHSLKVVDMHDRGTLKIHAPFLEVFEVVGSVVADDSPMGV